ncbi:hypothetical protein [Tolumonas lignilytica]|uniref:hypothetical protein n=1 Tax=Tolumonas lignilytica TaxID=1283284 RepID=UPI000466597F|nr:hypothetical protein [Tolumonas lignilytica]
MPTISVNVDVDVELDDIDTQDLIDELERRGHQLGFKESDNNELLEKIYQALVSNDQIQPIALSRDLVFNTIGSIV